MSVRSESGQATAVVALFAAALVGIFALVLTVGSWYRTHRQLQTAVDASALAAAQDLPIAATATATANTYLQGNETTNSGVLSDTTPCGTNPAASAPSCSITFPATSPCTVNACVQVDGAQSAAGPFASLLNGVIGVVGLSPITVRAHATAAIGAPASLNNVAPVAVPQSIVCTLSNPACFGQPVTLTVPDGTSSSGSAVLNLKCAPATSPFTCATSPNTSDFNSWITAGFGSPLPVNRWYAGVGGQHAGLKQGLQTAAAAQTKLLFPVYDALDAATGAYHIIGFSAFQIDASWDGAWSGSTKSLPGKFVTYIAQSLPGTPPQPGVNNFGVNVIELLQ